MYDNDECLSFSLHCRRWCCRCHAIILSFYFFSLFTIRSPIAAPNGIFIFQSSRSLHTNTSESKTPTTTTNWISFVGCVRSNISSFSVVIWLLSQSKQIVFYFEYRVREIYAECVCRRCTDHTRKFDSCFSSLFVRYVCCIIIILKKFCCCCAFIFTLRHNLSTTVLFFCCCAHLRLCAHLL